MPYSSPELSSFRDQAKKWKRLSELVEDYKAVRSTIHDVIGGGFPYFKLMELHISFHGPSNTAAPIRTVKLPLAGKEKIFTAIHDTYGTLILTLAKDCGLDWDIDYLTDKLTKN